MLDKINVYLLNITKVNQWEINNGAINWFKNIKNKQNCKFSIVFGIKRFLWWDLSECLNSTL